MGLFDCNMMLKPGGTKFLVEEICSFSMALSQAGGIPKPGAGDRSWILQCSPWFRRRGCFDWNEKDAVEGQSVTNLRTQCTFLAQIRPDSGPSAGIMVYFRR